METQKKLAFEFAQSTIKQLMNLATGVVAFTVTFSKDFLQEASPEQKSLVVLAWIAFLLSVAAGQWALMSLTGTLDKMKAPDLSIYSLNISIPTITQILLFLCGLTLTVLFAANTL